MESGGPACRRSPGSAFPAPSTAAPISPHRLLSPSPSPTTHRSSMKGGDRLRVLEKVAHASHHTTGSPGGRGSARRAAGKPRQSRSIIPEPPLIVVALRRSSEKPTRIERVASAGRGHSSEKSRVSVWCGGTRFPHVLRRGTGQRSASPPCAKTFVHRQTATRGGKVRECVRADFGGHTVLCHGAGRGINPV